MKARFEQLSPHEYRLALEPETANETYSVSRLADDLATAPASLWVALEVVGEGAELALSCGPGSRARGLWGLYQKGG